MSSFLVDFIAGVYEFAIVAWLLTFRMKEFKDSWKAHARIRHYFGLTLTAVVIYFTLGVTGLVFIKSASDA